MGGNTAAERNDGKITKIGCLQAVGYFFGIDEIRILETQESRQAVGGLSVHVRVLSLLRTKISPGVDLGNAAKHTLLLGTNGRQLWTTKAPETGYLGQDAHKDSISFNRLYQCFRLAWAGEAT